jgi:hypothetical protein
MTDYKKYINALRKCAKEHEDDRTSFGHIIVSDLCRDTANLLESLEQQTCEDTISKAAIDTEGLDVRIPGRCRPMRVLRRQKRIPERLEIPDGRRSQ